jgi:hypothetical protein
MNDDEVDKILEASNCEGKKAYTTEKDGKSIPQKEHRGRQDLRRTPFYRARR